MRPATTTADGAIDTLDRHQLEIGQRRPRARQPPCQDSIRLAGGQKPTLRYWVSQVAEAAISRLSGNGSYP